MEQIIYDISLGIFTGAIISLITALITYFLLKGKRINEISKEIKENLKYFMDIFNSVQYIFFKDKLEEELIKNNIYNGINKKWYEDFTKNNIETL